MSPTPQATKLLQSSKLKLLDEIADLSFVQLTYTPSPGKWNILEVLEHITIVEIGIAQLVQQKLMDTPDVSRQSEIKVSDRQVYEMLTNRRSSAQSPDAIKPTSRFPTAESAKDAFIKNRDQNIYFIRNTTEDLRARYWHHPVTGTIDLYQTLLLISAHYERHIMQIAEIKSSPGFPVNG